MTDRSAPPGSQRDPPSKPGRVPEVELAPPEARHPRELVLERRLAAAEARLRDLIDKNADAIVVVDPDGLVRFANPAAARLFGRTAADLLNAPFGFPIMAGETTELDVARPGGAPRVAEMRVVETEWNGSPALLASLRDITERKEAEETARRLALERAARAQAEAAGERSRTLAEITAILGGSLDYRVTLQRTAEAGARLLADWCVVDVLEGGSCVRMAVAGPDTAPDARVRRIWDARPAEHAEGPIARAIASASPVPIRSAADAAGDPDPLWELPLRSAVVAPICAHERALGALTLVFTTGGRGLGPEVEELAQEIGRRACLAIENARLFLEAHEANQAKGHFLAIMSHELRTPLNAIIGYSDLMLSDITGRLDESARRLVGRMRSSARRLAELIEDILSFSRLETERDREVVERVRLDDVIGEVVALAGPLAEEKGLDFSVDVPQPAPILELDPLKVRQILLTLLTNAVKFTDRGGVRLRVRIEAEVLTLEVADSGRGIARDDLGRIFDAFWQAEDSLTRRSGGTGLGLAIAQRLAQLLGGEIRVQSEPGKGSVFTVRLPVRRVRPGSD